MTHKTRHAHMHPQPIHGLHHLEKVGLPPQVLVVPVVVAAAVVVVAGAVPVAIGAAAALEVVLVLLHLPQMQMVQIHPDGGDLLPVDGKVQLRKLILVGIGSYYTVH